MVTTRREGGSKIYAKMNRKRESGEKYDHVACYNDARYVYYIDIIFLRHPTSVFFHKDPIDN